MADSDPLRELANKIAKDQANKIALDQVKAEKPSQFTVGGYYNGKTVTGGLTFARTWKNGWGATAYARAWWNDQAVTPSDRSGVVLGGEGVYKF